MTDPAHRRPVQIRVRAAQSGDMIAAAQVYLAAFPDSVEQLALHSVRDEAIADILSVCLAAEPEGFVIAGADGRVVGYCVCLAHADRLLRVALHPARLCRMAWRWLTGRYGVGLITLLRILADQFHLRRSRAVPEAACNAVVVSIAVHPQFQGRGLGRILLERGLDYLRSQHAPCVRLTVRPGNLAARRLYQKYGFVKLGEVRDARGSWEVMILRWPAGAS